MTEVKIVPRLKQQYKDDIAPKLKQELGLKNINQVPKLQKIVVSSGIGKKKDDNASTK